MEAVAPAAVIEAMDESLAALADREIDYPALLFDRFLAAFPGERAKFLNLAAARTRMSDETLQMLYGIASGERWVDTAVADFVDLHRNYGTIDLAVYCGFVDLAVETLAIAAGDAWTDTAASGWERAAGVLKSKILRATGCG